MVSKPTATTAKASKVAESTPAIVAEKPKYTLDKALIESTSHETTPKETAVVIIHTTISIPIPINLVL